MHQWWGDNVAEGAPKLMWFKEGQATTAEYYQTALPRPTPPAARAPRPATRRSRPASSRRFATNYNSTSTTFWNTAPSNPTSVTMNGTSNAYTRPGTSYLALRAILGKDNYNAVLHHIQTAYRGGSMTEENLKKEFHKYTAQPVARLPQQARRVLHAVVGHAVHGLARGRQQAVDHRPGPGRRRLL